MRGASAEIASCKAFDVEAAAGDMDVAARVWVIGVKMRRKPRPPAWDSRIEAIVRTYRVLLVESPWSLTVE